MIRGFVDWSNDHNSYHGVPLAGIRHCRNGACAKTKRWGSRKKNRFEVDGVKAKGARIRFHAKVQIVLMNQTRSTPR